MKKSKPPKSFKGKAQDYKPARGYRWRDFTGPGGDNPGWLVGLRHGARSERVWGPLARELVTRLLESRPDLAAYPWALQAWARSETRLQLLELYLERTGITDGEGEPRRSHLQIIQSCERLCIDLRRELGLSPASHAHLLREVSEAAKNQINVEKLVEDGAKIIELRQARGEISS